MIAYDKHNYNCAHHAAKMLNEKWGCNIPVFNGDEWQPNFFLQLRKHFKRCDHIKDGCLVFMVDLFGNSHVGIARGYDVEHNWSDGVSAGSVIISDIGTIKAHYKKVRFYEPR